MKTFRASGIVIILSFQLISAVTKDSLFNQISEIVYKNFYDSTFNKLDWPKVKQSYAEKITPDMTEKTFASTVNEFLSKLNTSHTYYYTPEDQGYYHFTDLFKDSPFHKPAISKIFKNLEVTYEDIGIFTKTVGNEIFVSAVLDSSPAVTAGILIGDRIVQVDGKPFEPVGSFKGKAGKKTVITIQRTKDGSSLKTVIVKPEMYKPNEMFYDAMKKSARIIKSGDKKIAYVHVWSFAGEQYYSLLKELLTTKLKDCQALILDIRDGYGGANPEYLDIFNNRIPVLKQQTRNGESYEMPGRWVKPVVLLINGGTRSGKEILAFAFRKYGYGKIVGSRTAGAVVAGAPFYLSDGSMIYLAVASCTVDGEKIEGAGIEPDIKVEQDIQYCEGNDLQLKKAAEVAGKTVK